MMWTYLLALLVQTILAQEIFFPVDFELKPGDPCKVSFTGEKGRCSTPSKCKNFEKLYNEAGSYRKIACRMSHLLICCPDENFSPRIRKLLDLSPPQNAPTGCGFMWSDYGTTNLLKFYQSNKTAENLEQQGAIITNHIVDGDFLQDFTINNGTHSRQYLENQGSGPFVFRGEPARQVLTTYMAIIGADVGSEIEWFCDGALINWEWILTAAHCFRRTPTVVRLGEYDLGNDTATAEEDPQDYNIKKVILYPDYEFPSSNHDLALIQLDRPTFISRPDINPICLPWGEKSVTSLVGEQVTLTGWGATTYGGPTTNILQEANITVFDPSVCDNSYSKLKSYSTKFPTGIKKQTHVCAGNEITGADACQGDSGGPIVYEDSFRFYLGGIVSAGHGCGLKEFPGIYTPLHNPEHLSWIKKVAFS